MSSQANSTPAPSPAPDCANPARQWFFLGLAVCAMLAIYFAPLPDPVRTARETITLTAQGKATMAVLAFAVILWMTEAIPFPVTGLMAMLLLVITRAARFKDLVRDGFGNHIIIFFIGVLVFSAAISQTALLRRITNWVLYKFGHKPRTIVFAVLVVGALLSGWITDMAVAAMLLPIGVSILRDAKCEPQQSNFGRALMIACAWGPLVGGISTPAGCGPNPLTIGFLKDLAGIDFTFLDWMIIGMPAMLMMLPCAWLILLRVFPIEAIDLKITEEDFRTRARELGPLGKQEIVTMVLFLLMVFLWIAAPWIKAWTGGSVDFLSISFVACACACLFFLPGFDVLSWKKAEQEVSWGGIILIVAGLGMGMAVYKTGAAAWMAYVAFHKVGALHPVIQIFIVVFGVSLMKVMFSSNTVTGLIIVPLLIALATTLDINPAILAIPAGITASLAFLLVTSTPTNVIPYSSGYFTIKDMARAGAWMTVASSVCVTISISIFGRLFHIISW